MTEDQSAFRRRLRETAAVHVPPQFVDEVVDLAMHAHDRAFAAIGPITTSASNVGVAMCATGIALSLIAAEAADKVEKLKIYTVAKGGTATTATVSAGGANG